MRIANIEIIFIKDKEIYCQHLFPVTAEAYDLHLKDTVCPMCHKSFMPFRKWHQDIDIALALSMGSIIVISTIFILGKVFKFL